MSGTSWSVMWCIGSLFRPTTRAAHNGPPSVSCVTSDLLTTSGTWSRPSTVYRRSVGYSPQNPTAKDTTEAVRARPSLGAINTSNDPGLPNARNCSCLISVNIGRYLAAAHALALAGAELGYRLEGRTQPLAAACRRCQSRRVCTRKGKGCQARDVASRESPSRWLRARLIGS